METATITKPDMAKLVDWTVRAGRLLPDEQQRLQHSLAAQIIIATAYLSGCTDPARISVSHLLTLTGAVRTRGLFGHQQGGSLADRLLPVCYYPGGDETTVKAGMLLLELLSLQDHKQDLADDILQGNQNPLILEMDYQEEYGCINAEYLALPAQIKNQFCDLYRKVILAGVWF